MSYDKKYKKRTIEYHEEGHTIRETAEVFKISPNTLNEWLKQYRQTGELGRKHRSYESKIDAQELTDYLKEHPDAYQKEMAEHFKCAESTVCKTLNRFKITRKKRPNVTKNSNPKK